ncbi:thiamine pyrophosphate-dependent dehydrogenase E1 component subunit alpha [Actinomadura sp. B10D3]|uniref:thiamine pyrophosphate-dependent dehydrogenase E1 component subunit alpha n=1 Tax=Actinomadura sp. B10D3 TaxID=3153557 RepID=UPI00325E2680
MSVELEHTGLRVTEAEAAELYRRMAVIRRFEQAAYRAYEQGEVHGTVHVSIGQEAVAVGVMDALRPGDTVLSHHRGHGHALAKGVDPGRLMAELCGRAGGVSRGKGGSMHATDLDAGFLGTLAVVGAAIPLGVGYALAQRLKGTGAVCVVFFGDGAVNQGVLYESLNLAALWSLPVLFVCENNAYAITTAAHESTAGDGIAARARAFGVDGQEVDGQDVLAVRRLAASMAEAARNGRPGLMECLTYRFMGHSRGDPPHGIYRTKAELEAWTDRDPLALLATAAGLTSEDTGRFQDEARRIADDAMSFALASPVPDESSLLEDVV